MGAFRIGFMTGGYQSFWSRFSLDNDDNGERAYVVSMKRNHNHFVLPKFHFTYIGALPYLVVDRLLHDAIRNGLDSPAGINSFYCSSARCDEITCRPVFALAPQNDLNWNLPTDASEPARLLAPILQAIMRQEAHLACATSRADLVAKAADQRGSVRPAVQR